MKKNENLKRLQSYAGSFKVLTYLSWILSAISSLVALVPFYYIWRVVHDALAVAPNFEKADQLVTYGWYALGYAVLSIMIYILAILCSHMSAFRVASNIKKDIIQHIAKLPLGVIENYGSGKVRSIIEGAANTETYLAHRLPDRAGAIATPIGLIFLLLIFDWRLGLLSLCPVILGFIIMMKMTGKEMENQMKKYRDALADMTNEAVEYIRGIPVVKTFGQTIFSFQRFKETIDSYEKWAISYTKLLRIPMLCFTTAINSVFVFLIIGTLWFTQDGITHEFLLNLIFYIIITPCISISLTKIMYMSEDFMLVDDALQKIDDILQECVLVDGHLQASQKHDIHIEHVSFQYDASHQALADVSLHIPTGHTIALIGPSGGGKTTLANLIARFFDVQHGSISIGDINIKDMDQKSLHESISYVFQNSKLIQGSILENVRMAKPDASKQEVLDALHAAQCDDIVAKLPEGIDTIIGSQGIYLSGGEMQRIAIARAIVKDAPILLLDEATAFADPDNEVRVQQALSNLAKGKTVIMIAHRLSSIQDVDHIYVLNNGMIVEHGSPQELIHQQGMYQQMWEAYKTSVDWNITKEAQA